ncbi:unnamed protein product [Cercospora beticola]|nr:unnamed protein product [Cercospora beticola]
MHLKIFASIIYASVALAGTCNPGAQGSTGYCKLWYRDPDHPGKFKLRYYDCTPEHPCKISSTNNYHCHHIKGSAHAECNS